MYVQHNFTYQNWEDTAHWKTVTWWWWCVRLSLERLGLWEVQETGCRGERKRSSFNISSLIPLMFTPSSMSACLIVEGWGSSSAMANVKGWKYHILHDCLALCIFHHTPFVAAQSILQTCPKLMCLFKVKVILFCNHCNTVNCSGNLISTVCSVPGWLYFQAFLSLLYLVLIHILSFCNCISYSSASFWSWDAKTSSPSSLCTSKTQPPYPKSYWHIYCYSFEAFKIVQYFIQDSFSKHHFSMRLLAHWEHLQGLKSPILYCGSLWMMFQSWPLSMALKIDLIWHMIGLNCGYWALVTWLQQWYSILC